MSNDIIMPMPKLQNIVVEESAHEYFDILNNVAEEGEEGFPIL